MRNCSPKYLSLYTTLNTPDALHPHQVVQLARTAPATPKPFKPHWSIAPATPKRFRPHWSICPAKPEP